MENRKRKSNDEAPSISCENKPRGDSIRTKKPLSTSPIMNDPKRSRNSPSKVQWDISVDNAKAVFAELKVNFLPPKSLPDTPATTSSASTPSTSTVAVVTPERRIESEKENHDSGYNSVPAPILARAAANSGLTPSLANFMLDSPHGLRRMMFGRKVRTRKELIVKRTTIDDLSNEMLLKIFFMLPWKVVLTRCSTVNRRWYNLSQERILFSLSGLDFKNRTLTSTQLISALSTGARHVRLAGLTISDSSVFLVGSSRRFYLQNLDLSMAVMPTDHLNGMLDGNEDGVSLIRLSLENLKINEKTLEILRKKHPKLQILNLASCRVDNEGKSLDDTSFPAEIMELNLSWVEGLPISLAICDLGPKLDRLNLSGMRNLMNSDVMILVKRCPNLIELDISDCELLTPIALMKIKEGLKNLKALNISRNYRMDNWLALAVQIRSLETVSTFGLLPQMVPMGLPFAISTSPISTIARPTVGLRRSTIWGIKVYQDPSEQQ